MMLLPPLFYQQLVKLRGQGTCSKAAGPGNGPTLSEARATLQCDVLPICWAVSQGPGGSLRYTAITMSRSFLLHMLSIFYRELLSRNMEVKMGTCCACCPQPMSFPAASSVLPLWVGCWGEPQGRECRGG